MSSLRLSLKHVFAIPTRLHMKYPSCWTLQTLDILGGCLDLGLQPAAGGEY